ncbi:hypothetical protein Ct9H90mP29_13170 [bacterium]|nr:MAG: hypothetical protein Ct9H90mP29_13170 [bacterium]
MLIYRYFIKYSRFFGNALVNDTIQFQTADESPPLVQSSDLVSTNEYVIISFSEGVYSTNSGTGGIELST